MLDELRGLALIAMVIYHVFYSAAFLFGMDWGISAYVATTPFEPLIAVTFILISGVCCSLSRSNLKRGIRLLFIALAVTLVTVFFTPGNEIYFGVLHLLSLSMIIYALLEKAAAHVPPLAGAAVCLILYFLLWGVPRGYLGLEQFRLCSLPSFLYSSDFFAFLGFPSATFFSADYFPIVPHLFLFLCGCFLGRLGKTRGFPQFLKPLRVRPLAFLGRHSLEIYVVHQPVIVGVLYAVSMIL